MRVDMSPKEILKLTDRVLPRNLFLMRDVFDALRADPTNNGVSDRNIAGWTAAAAYRAGRLSMWRDCRKQAKQKSSDALLSILRRNGKGFAKDVLTYAASLEKAIAGGVRRDE